MFCYEDVTLPDASSAPWTVPLNALQWMDEYPVLEVYELFLFGSMTYQSKTYIHTTEKHNSLNMINWVLPDSLFDGVV